MAEDLAIKTFIYALLGGFVPAVLWLWFWLKEDKKRPEPKKMILETFIAGGAAVFLSFVIQSFFIYLTGQKAYIDSVLADSTRKLLLPFFLSIFPIFLVWAFVEELMKFITVWLVALKSRFNDEPIDPMIYMIVGALGFVAIENTLFILDSLITGGQNLSFLITSNLRFLGSSVVHIVSSAIIGASISLSYCYNPWRRRLNIIWGFILGTLLHAAFNFFIIKLIAGGSNLGLFKIFIIWWLIAVIILFFFEKIKSTVCSPSFIETINKFKN